MNQESRPNQGKGGNRHGKHHRRKPYYIKKNNEGDRNEALHENEENVTSAPVIEEKPETSESSNREQGNHHNHSRRDRNRNRRNRDKRNKVTREPDASAEILTSESQTMPEAEEDIFSPAQAEDEIPEVIVSLDDEIVPVEDDTPKVHVTGVRFKPGGKVYYFDHGDLKIKNNSYVIVDTARGLEFGEVAFGDKTVKETSLVLPLRQVVRVATEEDIKRNAENKKKEEEAFSICQEKICKHGLEMKLIEAQYSFDNSKLLFYFTSASRVDFRELVKDLASVFKTRIELRQIGIRDEAKIMGGLGACGRPLCCATFLSDFVQVSIKMAKEQNLSLNSGKISGCCGRLMCCLQYEYQTYREEGANTPSVDSTVKTKDGVGTVTESNALSGTIKVRLKDKPDSPPVLYKRDDVTVISRGKKADEDEE